MYRLATKDCNMNPGECLKAICATRDPRLAALLLEDMLYMLELRCLPGGTEPPDRIECVDTGENPRFRVYRGGWCAEFTIMSTPFGLVCVVDRCDEGGEASGGVEEDLAFVSR